MHRPFAALYPMNWRGLRRRLAALAALLLLMAPFARAIDLQFDYSHDATGFFGSVVAPTPARAALEWAGQTFEAFSDYLAPIQPAGNDSWTAQFIDPATGVFTGVPNLTVPASTLIVFAGARDLSGAQLGQAGPGVYSLSPNGNVSTEFVDAVVNRGQGSVQVDFAPWGGAIAFDTIATDGRARQWHFDLQSAPPINAYDFYTVAVHELAHLMGFGTSTAFAADLLNSDFVGAVAQELYGRPVPLSGGQHWAFGVTSPPYIAGTQPKPSLGPSLSLGDRKLFTPLDYAALADIGWSVPPILLGLPGDVDGDADVDGADFLIWQRDLSRCAKVLLHSFLEWRFNLCVIGALPWNQFACRRNSAGNWNNN